MKAVANTDKVDFSAFILKYVLPVTGWSTVVVQSHCSALAFKLNCTTQVLEFFQEQVKAVTAYCS